MKLYVAFVALIAVAAAGPFQRYSKTAELEAIVAAINSPCAEPTTAAALEQILLEQIGVNSPISVGPAIIEANPITVGPAIIEANPITVGPAIIGANPISVGPAIIEANPISVGPAMVGFPQPDGGALTVADEVPVTPIGVAVPVIPAPVAPSPAVVSTGSSLVQIIVNVNKESELAPSPSPVVAPSPVITPGPVNVVEGADNNTPISPVAVANPIVPSPVSVVNPIFPSPVSVTNPIVPSPVSVVNPIFPSPVSVVNPIVPSPVAVVTPVFPTPIQVGTPTLPVIPEPIMPSPVVVLPETLN